MDCRRTGRPRPAVLHQKYTPRGNGPPFAPTRLRGGAWGDLKSEVLRILVVPEFTNLPDLIQKRDRIITRVMEFAKSHNDRILRPD